MQGLADGYFVIPSTLSNYFASMKPGGLTDDAPEFLAVQKKQRLKLIAYFPSKGSEAWIVSIVS